LRLHLTSRFASLPVLFLAPLFVLVFVIVPVLVRVPLQLIAIIQDTIELLIVVAIVTPRFLPQMVEVADEPPSVLQVPVSIEQEHSVGLREISDS
jgi:hypothetical protein